MAKKAPDYDPGELDALEADNPKFGVWRQHPYAVWFAAEFIKRPELDSKRPEAFVALFKSKGVKGMPEARQFRAWLTELKKKRG